MNILLWVLQVLLALHTLTGAIWKISNTEQAVPSLSAIPRGAWLAMSGLEVVAAVGLVLPAVLSALGVAVPIAAGFIIAEMLLFTGLHLASGDGNHGQVVYWLVVAALCGFLVYGRLVLQPLAAR